MCVCMSGRAFGRSPGLEPMPEGTLKMRLTFLKGQTKSYVLERILNKFENTCTQQAPRAKHTTQP